MSFSVRPITLSPSISLHLCIVPNIRPKPKSFYFSHSFLFSFRPLTTILPPNLFSLSPSFPHIAIPLRCTQYTFNFASLFYHSTFLLPLPFTTSFSSPLSSSKLRTENIWNTHCMNLDRWCRPKLLWMISAHQMAILVNKTPSVMLETNCLTNIYNHCWIKTQKSQPKG